MKGNMRNIILVVAVVLSIGSVAVAVLSGQRVDRCARALNIERYNRIVAEEELQNIAARARLLEARFDEASGNYAHAQSELLKMTRLKEILEQQLKDALVGTPQ